jgi:two-component system chemotaxis sensor kinase CheA
LSSRDNADEISGRGIGLAAVKAELDRLGGTACVETRHNTGTLFRFLLPINANLVSWDGAALEMTA